MSAELLGALPSYLRPLITFLYWCDDCYHLENAAYCDLYVTEEASQCEYGDEILSATKVQTYDRSAPLAEWLVSIGTSE